MRKIPSLTYWNRYNENQAKKLDVQNLKSQSRSQ